MVMKQTHKFKYYLRFSVLFLTGILLQSICFAQINTIGLFEHDTTKTFNGYTLLIPKNYTSTYLIDNFGALIHQWNSQFDPAMSAYLLEDGTLLRSAKVEEEGSDPVGGFQLLDWDSSVLWEYYAGRQHHDIEPLPNGNVLLILNELHTSQEAFDAGRDPGRLEANNIRALKIIEVEQAGQDSGTIVWEWSLWDHLIQEYSDTIDNFGVVADHPELIDINFGNTTANWVHINSIDYNPNFDRIVVSSRIFNEIWVIDHSTTTAEATSHSGGNSGMGGDILYRWGNPSAYQAGTTDDLRLYRQHDAQWIEDGLSGEGNLMVFNNGTNRPEGAYSTIDEFTPPVDESGQYSRDSGSAFEPVDYKWSFQADPPEDFYSPIWSGAQRLPNGNTIMCSGDQSMILEVTEAGEVVWKYISPVSDNGLLQQGEPLQDNHLGRVQKYGVNYPGLDGKDLTPGVTLGVMSESGSGIPDGFILYNNYPNPFNNTTTIHYEISQRSRVDLMIYDILGREIINLDNGAREVGLHSIHWNGFDNENNKAGAGIYLYQLQVGQYTQTKKMILLK
jgi:hypothetical protein